MLLLAVLTVAITAAYRLTLPFAFTQRLSLRNWQFLTPRLLGFAMALGIRMAFLLTVQVHAFRRAAAARRASGDKALSGFALVVSLLPTFLCCTPVIPAVLATFRHQRLQHDPLAAAVLRDPPDRVHRCQPRPSRLTAWRSLRRVARADCLSDTGCELPT